MGHLFDLDLGRTVKDYHFPTFLKHMGIEQVSVRPGHAILTWKFNSLLHANGIGIAHGGALSTLLDVVMGYSAGYANEKITPVVTTSMTAHYIAAAGNVLKVEANVIRQTKHLAFCSAEITNTDGTIVTQAMATFKKLISTHQHNQPLSVPAETLP
ncbi:hypothetical protein GCM10011450_11620 [Advenella faeciporci]|uniref:Thioesterase domain-containing protein n=1 Tax=Advenella faeciporci TaxID=797535 RepID=A0A918JJI8_9BURK|nr:PaaI family thioesterase [Advenella faeciporci]GGW83346.1 hypothetical protein GCM10011450_11620 [Advenella faeciporci]